MRFALIIAVFFLISCTTVSIAADCTPPDNAKVEQNFGMVPLYFIENKGQIESEEVAYYLKGTDETLYFTNEGITFSLQGNSERWTVKLEFVGANLDVVPRGEGKQDVVFSYFKGKPFVVKIHASGATLEYCGYIEGTDTEYGYGITVDRTGAAYVTGYTHSRESEGFPVSVGPDLIHNGSSDAFVAKLPPYHVFLRAGNVLTGVLNPKDVFFVNHSPGEDCYRTIVNPPGTPVTLSMRAPPGGPNPTAFALYAWPGEAGSDDAAVQPYDIGSACFPMPLGSGIPSPYTVVNNIGYPFFFGHPRMPNIPPAPTDIFQNRTLIPGT